jgi:hypothetical protein
VNWHFPITIVDDPTLKMHFSAMKQADVVACVRWLEQMEKATRDGKKEPAPTLLLKGLPRGSLREARITTLNGRQYIAFTVSGRTERLVDLATFCCMRLMALPGGDCEWWFDRSTKKNLPEELQRFYPRFTRRKGIWGYRIFADAAPGEVIRQRSRKKLDDHWGFRDLRFINFFRTTRRKEQQRGKPMRSTYKGRAIAIDSCLENFRHGVNGIALTPQGYRSLLARAFTLLDQLHAHQIEDRTAGVK